MVEYYRGKIYYKTRFEAEKNRHSGDCIYYVANLGYYIVRRPSSGYKKAIRGLKRLMKFIP